MDKPIDLQAEIELRQRQKDTLAGELWQLKQKAKQYKRTVDRLDDEMNMLQQMVSGRMTLHAPTPDAEQAIAPEQAAQ